MQKGHITLGKFSKSTKIVFVRPKNLVIDKSEPIKKINKKHQEINEKDLTNDEGITYKDILYAIISFSIYYLITHYS